MELNIVKYLKKIVTSTSILIHFSFLQMNAICSPTKFTLRELLYSVLLHQWDEPIALYRFILKEPPGYRYFRLSLLLPGKTLQNYSNGEQAVTSGY